MNITKTKIWMVVALLFATATVVGLIRARGDGGSVGEAPASAPSHNLHVGGMTNLDGLTLTPTQNTDGLTVGSSTPTLVKNIIHGTCALLGGDIAQAATTSAYYDCAITGVVPADQVFVSLSTTTAPLVGNVATVGTVPGWAVVSSKASTTNGFITLLIANWMGASKAISAFGVGSSTQYWIIR